MQQTALLQRTEKPAFPLPMEHGSYWLLINGACSESLEEQVVALNGRRHHHWLWRGTAREYGIPGYRQGPMLVPLNEALFDTFLTTWAPTFAGLLMRTQANQQVLLAHLAHSSLITAQGNPVAFSLCMLRKLEELSEALTDLRLAQLLGPVESAIWLSATGDDQWMALHHSQSGANSESHEIHLCEQEESVLDHANAAWFMRHSLLRIQREQSDLVAHITTDDLIQRLGMFKSEAEVLGISRERDVHTYFILRLSFPEKYFVNDKGLVASLCDRTSDPRQRLGECEFRLRQLPLST